MNAILALKDILKKNPYLTVKKLNERLGYASPNAVSQRLGRKNISLENLIEFSDALNYDVVLVPKGSHEYALNEYVLTSNKSESGEPE